MKYMVLGPSALKKSEIKLLIKENLLHPKFYKPTIDDAYLESHLDLLRVPSRKSVRDYALKYLRESAGTFIDKWAEKSVIDYSTIINRNLITYHQQLKNTVKETMSDAMARKKTAKQMVSMLRDKTHDLAKDWDRVVTTELAQAQNLGALDAITENNPDKEPNEVYVYKTGPHDSKTCKWCKLFWFLGDGVTPKVYKLSELMANGSNYGKKQRDWLPTIENTHPNERHFLMELPTGFGFINGKLSFIAKDHNEHKKQNS